MLKSLWKLQWKSLFSRFQNGTRRGKKMSGGTLIILMVFLVLCIEGFAFIIFEQLSALCAVGLSWLYFTMAGISALALSTIGCVFTTQAQLYDAKDNELLLSMPIPPKYILLTRISSLFVTTAGYTFLVLLPAFLIYAVHFGATFMAVIGWVFVFLSLSLLAQSVCCALGWVLHKLLSRLRNKAFVSLLYMVVFMAAYYYFYTNVSTLLTQLIAQGSQIADTMQTYVWLLYAVGAACTGSLPHMAIVTAVSAALAAFTFWRLSATFIRSISAQTGKSAGRRKTGKISMRPRSVIHAVAHKELRRFFTSPAYLMNFGFGLVLLPVLPAAALIFRGTLMQTIRVLELPDSLTALCVLGAAAFCIATSCATSPSISLEGKSLWILRAMPISGRAVLMGKLLMVCRLQIPLAAFSAWALCWILDCGAVLTMLTVCAVVGFCWFVSAFGLVINLLAPRFDWQNESQPCKQSMSVFVTLFGSYFFALLAAGVFFAFCAVPVSETLCAALTALFVVLCALLMHVLLVFWGSKRFERLEA